MFGKLEVYIGVFVLILFFWWENVWIKNWLGSGYFLFSGNKWFYD